MVGDQVDLSAQSPRGKVFLISNLQESTDEKAITQFLDSKGIKDIRNVHLAGSASEKQASGCSWLIEVDPNQAEAVQGLDQADFDGCKVKVDSLEAEFKAVTTTTDKKDNTDSSQTTHASNEASAPVSSAP